MQLLSDHKVNRDLQILDNEASAEYKRFVKKKCNIKYQLVPPNTHRSNAAERDICTFKAHFISILAGVDPDSPMNLRDLLLPQMEVYLNLLQQETLDPSRSAWAYFYGPFNYDATPLGPLRCNIMAHKKTGTRKLWDFCGTAGWDEGVALHHYRCHTIVSKAAKAAQVSETVEFRHHHLTLPDITPTDRIVHGVTTLTCDLQDAPSIACNNQLAAIQALCQVIHSWDQPTLTLLKVTQVTTPLPTLTRRRSVLRPMRCPKTV